MDDELLRELAEREANKPECFMNSFPYVVVSKNHQEREHFATYLRVQFAGGRAVHTRGSVEGLNGSFNVLDLDELMSQGGA